MTSSSLLLCLALAIAAAPSFAVKVKLVNNCKFTIWPGLLGPKESPLPWDGGLKLNAGEVKDINLPAGWQSNRIWARTGCDGNYNCETGFCGPKLKCARAGGEPPVSLAEFTLARNSSEKDFYDVSYVDGYNVQITIEPVAGSFIRDVNDKYSCGRAGQCTGGDPLKLAPEELKQRKNGKVVAVYTGCSKTKLNSYCCNGTRYDKPETCVPSRDWPVNYYSPLKKLCPTGYWYAYDDKTSTFTCKGANGISADYKLTFC